jgi:hypothetical protein
MNEILHANIFFIIASVATVCFCILVSIALYHVIKILQTVRSVLERIEAGSEVLAGDLAQMRSFFAEGGFFSRFFGSFMPGAKARKSRRKRTTDISDLDNDE